MSTQVSISEFLPCPQYKTADLQSVGPTVTFKYKPQKPDRADQQKLDILEKGWLLALDLVADELANPGQHKNDDTTDHQCFT